MYNGRHAYLTKENNFVYNKVLWNYYKLRQVSLLQSAMDSYYKWGQLFYYKVRHGLLQVATGITCRMDLLAELHAPAKRARVGGDP